MSRPAADDAVSEVIAFLLIFAVIVAAVAVYLLVAAPAEGRQAEIQHDDLVLDQFAQLKSGVDLLWTADRKGINASRLISLAPAEATDLATRLFLAPSLGSGLLQTGNGTSFIFNDSSDGQHLVSLLSLSYASHNQYAADYTIIYDGGAVFYGETNETTYLLLAPVIGNTSGSDKKSAILINATQNNVQTTLGNLPFAVEYQYTGKSTTYTDVSNLRFSESAYSDYWKTTLTGVSNLTILEYTMKWRAV